ncbi:hypothetical protein [Brasilonema sp. UFV-L1]|uniref:hypothetical protein n=1 Tax=Brasilonema sp. UFV-L1 TaxID=2234130 RepID=UPI00145F9770|nr:hypothetical protein [Brasilonema sp. UFV-L1]NMG11116.1 hypothetical protein [Brasilonema sp. UFV-L1]
MKILGDILNKAIWLIILLLAFGAGYVFILRNFLSPPPVPTTLPGATNNNTPLPQEQATNPNQTEIPTPNPSSSASPSPLKTESPTPLTPSPQPTPKQDSTSSTPSSTSYTLPALALPNQVALSVPKKLTPGAILSIYENLDNNSRPDPINYSPTTTKEVAGLSLTSVRQSEFQEVSGYFLAQKSGNYAFVISFPDNLYIDSNNLRLRIDGQPLGNVKGGSVNLEKGWHKVDLFYYEQSGNGANQIQVKWGLEGSSLVRLQTWRPAS